MTAAAIQLDLDLLDELFDNQKKLDAALDEDFFIGSPMLFEEKGDSSQKSNLGFGEAYLKDDFVFDFDDSLFDKESRSIYSVVVPVVLEIAIIAYGLMYFYSK